MSPFAGATELLSKLEVSFGETYIENISGIKWYKKKQFKAFRCMEIVFISVKKKTNWKCDMYEILQVVWVARELFLFCTKYHPI